MAIGAGRHCPRTLHYFADGIAAGARPEDLCQSFGEPKSVAKLISAAKRRGRPLWWQTWHNGVRRCACLIGVMPATCRRKRGVYPATLDALTPGLLPAIPPDRYDGKPLKYRLVGEGSAARPVVYSIGVDRVDDGGRGPKEPRNAVAMFQFKTRAAIAQLMANPNPKLKNSIKGDWILYGPE